jgi:hypothetical protein
MSVSHFLFRVREYRPDIGLDKIVGHCLPIAPAEEVKSRLLARAGFKPEPEERRAHRASFIEENPALRGMPAMRCLIFDDGESERSVVLEDDPVRSISIDHSAPATLLPIVDALADLGPFVILGDDGGVNDPVRLASRDPIAGEPPPFEVHRSEAPSGSSTLSPCWCLSTRRYLTATYSPVLAGGRIVISVGGYIAALDPASGSRVWGLNFPRGHLHLTPATGSVLAGGDYQDLYSISTIDGSVLWRSPVEGRLTSPATLCPDGRIVAGSATGSVACFAPDGRPLWKKRLPTAIYTPIRWAGDRLLVPTNDGSIHVLDHDGEEITFVQVGSNWIEVLVLGRWAFICTLEPRESGCVRRYTLPHLDDPIRVDERSPGSRFMGALGEDLFAHVVTESKGRQILVLVDPGTLNILHEIPCDAQISPMSPLGGGLWAIGLRPLRQSKQNQAVAILKPEKGQILCREELSGQGWCDSAVLGGNGYLFTTWRGEGPQNCLQAFRLNLSDEPGSQPASSPS